MLSYTELRDTLQQEITKKEQSLDSVECNQAAYEKNNWAYLQAHRNGYRSALRSFRKLIEILDQKDKDNDPRKSNNTKAGGQSAVV